MIDWWGLFHNSLWIVGLAVGLAVLSVADYQAHRQGIGRRQKLGEAGVRIPLVAGVALFCLGLAAASDPWWQRGIWGVLGALFAGQAAWQWAVARGGGDAKRALKERLRSGQAGRALILAGLLVIGGWGVLTAREVVGRARSVQGHLQALQMLVAGQAGGPGQGALTEAGAHLSGMHEDLAAIDAAVGRLLPLGRQLRWVPEYGGDLAAARDLLEAAAGTASAGDRAFQALSPAVEILDGAGGAAQPASSVGERLLPVLAAAQPELERAQRELAAVRGVRARIETESLSPRVAGLLERLDRILPWFETGVDAALLAPGLLGAGGPRTCLIVAQNNQELRATGGFISGVGELYIERGKISLMTFDDSYAVDNFEVPHDLAPADFQATMGGQLWFFRDANWDVDFPTSARRMVEIYSRDRGVQAGGVVALDLTALQGLVDATGPIQVEGIEGVVTGANVLQVIQAQWGEPGGGSGQEWWLHRKDFMGEIARAAMDRLMAGEGLEPVKLARTLKKALDEKHILLYLADPQAADLLRRRNWDGAVAAPPVPFDALLVVDSNVGFNKVDPNVERSIHYQVDLSAEEGPQARVTLTYHNHSARTVEACIQEARYGDVYADMMDRCYWDYVRVYVPAGSQLLEEPGLPLPAGSLLARSNDALPQHSLSSPTLTGGDWTAWAAFFDLAPGAERTLTFDYQLPTCVLEHRSDSLIRYRLRIQKQPGTEAVPLRVEITLPPGAELVWVTPADLLSSSGMSSNLRTDRIVEIVFRQGGKP
jgi:hypothetical protein